ncbi:DUF2017 domain-containing protein [Paeniglutamicibacter sp. MACA_103]|uniref:DUF2017 domain-containing protein n=1 Tax=Paeniglutamicibacter sp. MACA_103 TaxID=3377337 RepID=UPI003894EC39
MARAFKNTMRGFSASLEAAERQLLRGLFEDVITLLEPQRAVDEDPLWAMVGLDPNSHKADFAAPSDRATKRLLPDADPDDAAASLEFRRLSERGIRERKIGALREAALLMESGSILLNEQTAPRFASAVNDVRLVLAERLGLESEEDAERIHAQDDWSKAETVDEYLALVYNFVTWLQESLMQAMLKSL